MSKTVNAAFAKFAVAFVAIAMMFSVVAPASAQSVDDMSLEELIALVTQLQAQLGGEVTTGGGVAGDVCPYTWTRNLNMGDTGADVMQLQKFLNSMPETMVAASGAGSAGMETQYYGPATGAAVANFQMKYRSEILSPLGLVNPTTFFGNSTRAQANDLCVVAMNDDDDDDMDDDDDDNDGPVSLSGEASLESAEIDDASDDEIEEGEEDAEVASWYVEFTNGDAEISRLDVSFDMSGAEPWDAFETVSLWVDGDKVAEEDADDEDEYLDEDTGTIRFSGLDIVAMEDEEVEIVIAVTTMNNVDSDERGTWNVSVDSMRYFDADGVASTPDSGLEFTDDVTFDLEEAGAEDELEVSSSNDDPNATTLILDEDDSETYVVFAFDIDSDDSTNDIEVTELVLNATTTGVGTGDNDFEELVDGDNIKLFVDGDEIDLEDVEVNGDVVTIEIDGGDFVIDAGEEVTVEVEVEFDALDPSNEGATIELSIDADEMEAEGADDLSASGPDQLQGTATGETHTLITEGIVILAEDVVTDTDTTGQDDEVGVFTIEFDVTAYENDFYIATSGVNFTVTDGATSTYTVTSTGEEDTDDIFTIEEGETETFTLKVNVTPNVNDDFRVTLTSVEFDDDPAMGSTETRTLSPASDYRTGYEFIQGGA